MNPWVLEQHEAAEKIAAQVRRRDPAAEVARWTDKGLLAAYRRLGKVLAEELPPTIRIAQGRQVHAIITELRRRGIALPKRNRK